MVSSICEKYGWKPDYVLNKIPWVTLQMMLVDSAWYDYDSKSTSGENQRNNANEFNLNSNTSEEDLKNFIDKINSRHNG